MRKTDDYWRRVGAYPYTQRPEAIMIEDAELFHGKHKLSEVISLDQFRKGAKMARHKDLAEAENGDLTEAEQMAIAKEKKPSLWNQTQGMKITMLVTACAAIVQGWQQSSINATSDSWQKDFPYDGIENDACGWKRNLILAGFVNAAPWVSASLIGTWLTDLLHESKVGRREALSISAIFCIACVLGSARSTSWQTLLVCRLLLGIGIGAKASIAPVLAAEVAQTEFRGRILILWQVFDALGIFLGFAFVWIVDRNWRVVLGSPAIPAVVLLFLVFVCPESPRFLVRTKKYKKAYLSLRRLKDTDVQAARDLFDIYIRLQWETVLLQGRDPSREVEAVFRHDIMPVPSLKLFPERVIQLWTVPRNRRACIAACLVMLAQQMCGINAIAFYSNTLFDNTLTNSTCTDISTSRLTQRTAPGDFNSTLSTNATTIQNTDVDWMNFGFGLANFVFSVPAYHLIDYRGRWILLLCSLVGMFFTLLSLAVGIFELAPKSDGAGFQAMISVLGIVAFTAFYGVGAGPIPFTLSAEVFPLAVRGVGMSFSVMVNFIGLSLIILFLPQVTKVLRDRETNEDYRWRGNAILLFYFMGFNALASVLVFFLVPSKTEYVSIESMNLIFGKTTRQRIKDMFSRENEEPNENGNKA